MVQDTLLVLIQRILTTVLVFEETEALQEHVASV